MAPPNSPSPLSPKPPTPPSSPAAIYHPSSPSAPNTPAKTNVKQTVLAISQTKPLSISPPSTSTPPKSATPAIAPVSKTVPAPFPAKTHPPHAPTITATPPTTPIQFSRSVGSQPTPFAVGSMATSPAQPNGKKRPAGAPPQAPPTTLGAAPSPITPFMATLAATSETPRPSPNTPLVSAL